MPQFAQIPSQLIENPQTIGEHLKNRRSALRLTQREVASIIGVSEDCITYWENRRSTPQIQFFPRIIDFLGYNPFVAETATVGERIKKYRVENGLSIKKLARKLSVEERTIAGWERNQVAPTQQQHILIKELIT